MSFGPPLSHDLVNTLRALGLSRPWVFLFRMTVFRARVRARFEPSKAFEPVTSTHMVVYGDDTSRWHPIPPFVKTSESKTRPRVESVTRAL